MAKDDTSVDDSNAAEHEPWWPIPLALSVCSIGIALVVATEFPRHAAAVGLIAFAATAVGVALALWRWLRSGGPHTLIEKAQNLNRERRAQLVLIAFWIVGCTAYWMLEPRAFHYDEWLFMGWLFIAPVVAFAAYKALRWAAAGAK
jgi:hypothetical protein